MLIIYDFCIEYCGDRSHSKIVGLFHFNLILFQSVVLKLICALLFSFAFNFNTERKKKLNWYRFVFEFFLIRICIYAFFNIWIVNDKPVSRRLNVLIVRRTFVVVIVFFLTISTSKQNSRIDWFYFFFFFF